MSQIIQKRFTGAPNKPRLSFDFGMRLLDKEAELERNCSVDIIQELVQLYTEAIEYYAYMKDKKSNDFQERMHKMFLRPDVIHGIRQNTPSSPTKSVTMQQRKLESENAKLQKSEVAKDLLENQSSKSLNRIIDYQKLRNIEIARKAVMDFKTQDQDLEKRLDSRRKSMLTKSMDGSRYLNTSIVRQRDLRAVSEESDSPPGSFVKLIEEEDEKDIEAELEVIMEKYCNEKAKRIAEVQVKFEVQLMEMQGEGALMEQIRQQIKTDMQSELLSISNEIEKQKNDEILVLKGGHRKNSMSLS